VSGSAPSSDATKELVISGNEISNTHTGVDVTLDATGQTDYSIAICGNTLSSFTTLGISFTGSVADFHHNIRISDNNIRANAVTVTACISVEYAYDFAVNNNNITYQRPLSSSAAILGIYIMANCLNGSCSGNSMRGKFTYGIRMSGSQALIASNFINKQQVGDTNTNASPGIWVEGNDCFIAGNYVGYHDNNLMIQSGAPALRNGELVVDVAAGTNSPSTPGTLAEASLNYHRINMTA
jgi:hypothetical protein